MKPNHISNLFGYIILGAMWLIIHIILLFVVVAMVMEGVFFDGCLIILAISALWTLLTVWFFVNIPQVSLTEQGVELRIMWHKRFYEWNQVQQAGIAWRPGGRGDPNCFVLLLPGGSRRRYKDRAFFIRNIGKIVRLPRKKEVIEYVIKHYGPLDFNLSDGRAEQSEVVE